MTLDAGDSDGSGGSSDSSGSGGSSDSGGSHGSTGPDDVDVVSGTAEAAADLADLWVDLAVEQRDHGSHLLAESNRTAIRDSLLRHAVVDGLYVARAGEDLVGFVAFDVESPNYTRDVTRGVVRNLYVVPDRRGEGVGSRLLRAAEADLADRGVDRVALEVLADNEDARRFYERAGYAAHRIELEKRVETDTKERG